MIEHVTSAGVWLNEAANVAGRLLLAPIGVLPAAASLMLTAAVAGIVLLYAYKHTSCQGAIRRVRNTMKADFLALSLFRDSIAVCLRVQVQILAGACRLFLHSLIPMAIMAVPTGLLLTQLGLWYQSRPLRIGEEVVVGMFLQSAPGSPWPGVELAPSPSIELQTGPVRVLSQRALFWNLRAKTAGYHQLVFHVDGQAVEKQLAAGDAVMRVSMQRPPRKLPDILWHPAESPFPGTSAVRSIEIQYPGRTGWMIGRDRWIIGWFAGSMVSALCFRRMAGVAF